MGNEGLQLPNYETGGTNKDAETTANNINSCGRWQRLKNKHTQQHLKKF